MSTKAPHSGFTLVELLFVFAIIAMLAAIFSPVYTKAREKARQALCMSNQRQIAIATTMYCQDNNELLPTADVYWTAIDLDKKVFVCPNRLGVMGYDYNVNLSGATLGSFTWIMQELVTLDGITPSSVKLLPAGSANAIIGRSIPNTYYAAGDADQNRHSGSFIGSFLDGHVAMLAVTPAVDLGWKMCNNATPYYPDYSCISPHTGSQVVATATGAASTASTLALHAGGMVRFAFNNATTANASTYVGLAAGAVTTGASLAYALCGSQGALTIYENGVQVALVTNPSYSRSDVLTIAYSGSAITYLKNTSILRIVNLPVNSPLTMKPLTISVIMDTANVGVIKARAYGAY